MVLCHASFNIVLTFSCHAHTVLFALIANKMRDNM